MKAILFLAAIAVFGATSAAAAPLRVVMLGDSLTSGYGLRPGEDYPARLEQALNKNGLEVAVENAGVSGDTTAGGLSRLEWALDGDAPPSLVIVALGANDMLRGIDPKTTERNLRAILEKLEERKIPVMLMGMKASLNLPPGYRKNFDALYVRLSKDFGVPLYPFFLEGVALDPKLNLDDGLHPNAAGVSVMVERTIALVQQTLARSGG